MQRHGRQRSTASELCFTLLRALLAGAGEGLKLGTGRGVDQRGVSGTAEGAGDSTLTHAGGFAGDDGVGAPSVAVCALGRRGLGSELVMNPRTE